MSAFSFTAPSVSAEELLAELRGLTSEENEQLQRDLYGTETPVAETESVLQKGVASMRDIISEMDLNDKIDYLIAVQRVPELVDTESDPAKFLRCEEFSAIHAARRLVRYWKIRCEVFGQERAFLPMTLSGAMAGMENKLLRGVHIPMRDDATGRAVFYWDRIRSAPPTCNRSDAIQIKFYVLQVLSERVNAQRRGCVEIINMNGYDVHKHYDRILTKRSVAVLETAPVKVKAVHLCGGSSMGAYMQVVAPVANFQVGKFYRLRRVVHRGMDQETLDSLAPYGLGAEHVPAERGGSVDVPQVLNGWLAWRISQEESDEA